MVSTVKWSRVGFACVCSFPGDFWRWLDAKKSSRSTWRKIFFWRQRMKPSVSQFRPWKDWLTWVPEHPRLVLNSKDLEWMRFYSWRNSFVNELFQQIFTIWKRFFRSVIYQLCAFHLQVLYRKSYNELYPEASMWVSSPFIYQGPVAQDVLRA